MCVENQENKQIALFFFLCVPLFCLPPLPPPPLFFPMLFMPAYILYLYTLSFISVTVIFTSSLDALTMQTHSSFNHVYSFSTLTTIVCCHRGIHENLGTKHKPTLFGGKARLEYKEP